jgi:hypothetical protein
MGPVILFDKSFLECINPGESVWFDNYFYPNICPMFFVETLAYLEKDPRPGSTPEDTIRVLANKTPQVSGNPNALHSSLCRGELGGASVDMHGSIIISRGRAVTTGGRVGVLHDQPPEAIAFQTSSIWPTFSICRSAQSSLRRTDSIGAVLRYSCVMTRSSSGGPILRVA